MPWKVHPPKPKPPYRSTKFNDERKWKTTHRLDDVLQVGKLKAVGYVIENKTYTTKEFDMDELARQLFNDGKIISFAEDNILRLLWVGDQVMMDNVIAKHKGAIEEYNWPTNSFSFLSRLASEDVSHKKNPEMYHVICDMFNSWCLHCERPLVKKCLDGSVQYLSSNPYDPDKE